MGGRWGACRGRVFKQGVPPLIAYIQRESKQRGAGGHIFFMMLLYSADFCDKTGLYLIKFFLIVWRFGLHLPACPCSRHLSRERA